MITNKQQKRLIDTENDLTEALREEAFQRHLDKLEVESFDSSRDEVYNPYTHFKCLGCGELMEACDCDDSNSLSRDK